MRVRRKQLIVHLIISKYIILVLKKESKKCAFFNLFIVESIPSERNRCRVIHETRHFHDETVCIKLVCL